VDQLVFKRVDLFLQFTFDRVCHLDCSRITDWPD